MAHCRPHRDACHTLSNLLGYLGYDVSHSSYVHVVLYCSQTNKLFYRVIILLYENEIVKTSC